ncbi:heme o synthase [Alicyclobacillus fastidiosus]|uniref:Protoheme IX farnesyltransferase n=1 Tax=Alicyclobacillus fastidiosus TaxID=392011 RepID=A0ABV5AKG9_9BACL|nr:heme o synthase [Alicyclobacillus fastidiosus]WEH08456.1 heme o synthase [Alicyclobacillus fastidiosus]
MGVSEQSVRTLGLSNIKTVTKAYVSLTKPRIMLFLIFTAYCAMFIAQRGVPNLQTMIVGLGGLALSAGGAAAINMWYDRDIDRIMQRTAKRPIPMGIVTPWHALVLGIGLGILSVVMLALWCNWLCATFSLMGYLYYAVVYTMWLKRKTPQNIVIGGGAGAFPPLVGWSAVTGHQGFAAWIMFAVIFLWTPAHFWSLALYKNDDYVRAGIPMMPIVCGSKTTKRQMVIYTFLLLLSSWLLVGSLRAQVLYIIMATAAGLLFLRSTLILMNNKEDQMTLAKRTFLVSLMYLPAVFAAAVVCALI